MESKRANKVYSNKERKLLGEFINKYVYGNTVTIYDKRMFAKACVRAFDTIRDNPVYEEFERLMESYPHIKAAT